VKCFDLRQLAEAPFSSIAYRSDRQIFLRMAPSPFPWASAEIFPWGATSKFCLCLSGWSRCNVNGRSQSASSILRQ